MQPIQQRIPGKKGLWIGVILIVIGVVGGIALVVVGALSVTHTVDHYQRVDARQGGTVTFSKTGRYNAYFERPGIRHRSEIPAVEVVLSGPGAAQTLLSDIHRTNTTEHYRFGDHEGVRITSFTIHRAGSYEVRVVAQGEPAIGTQGEIAFGRGSIVKGILGVVGGLVGGGLITFVGLIVFITSAVRRARYRKTMAGYGGGYGSRPPGGWPPAGPGSVSGAWPGPAAQPAPSGPPGPPVGWSPPPTLPPPARQPAWPPAAPPSGPRPGDDPGRPGWGGPGR